MSFLDKLFGPNIKKLQAKRDVPGLIKALRYRITSSDDDVHALRQAAVKALGQIGDTQAVEYLITALKDSVWNVRQAAAEALGQIGDAQAVEPLIAALKDSSWDVRQAAAEALDKLNWKPGRNETGAYYWVAKRAWQKCVEVGAPAVRLLYGALENSDKNVRQAASEALVKIGIPAVEPLIAALKNSSKDVRRAAAEALVKIGTPAIKPLIAALKNSSKDVRQTATEALVKIGDQAVESLCAALNDSDWNVHQAAAEALDKLNWKPDRNGTGAYYWIAKRAWQKCVEVGAPAVEPLCAALNDSDWNVHQAAAEALGKIGDRRAIPALRIALDAADSKLRDIALATLQEIVMQVCQDKGLDGSALFQ
jgi:HEAT repeat protein